jgi:uncharacterized protein
MARRVHRVKSLRLSAFNLYLPEYPEPGQTLIHNTFSGGFVVVPNEELETLRKADGGAVLSESESAVIDPDYFDDSVGILVEDRKSEEKAYRANYEQKRSGTAELDAIVSITFACNLDCTYCCQSDVLNGKMMKADLGDATARWLAGRAVEIGASTVKIAFVGGEPLLHPDRIEQVVADIKAFAPHVDVRFSLITNGVFLTDAMIDRLLPIGLRAAQVTLDGDETTHSITRRAKRNVDHYQTIFDNVIAASKRIRVNVNGNYQADTVHGFVPLLQKLKAAGLPEGSHVSFTPALAALGAPSDSAATSCTWSGSNPALMLALGDEVRRNGFDAGDPKSIGPCAFHTRHHYAIDPDGHIYKCAGFLGKSDWAVGHVTTGLNLRYQRLAESRPQRECGSCSHRPDCGGGCVAASWMASGRSEGVNCEKEFFDQYQSDVLIRRYALATSDHVAEALLRFPATRADVRATLNGSGKRSQSLRVLAA